MKIIIIALLIFFLNLSVAMVSTLGLFPLFNQATSNQWEIDVEQQTSAEYNADRSANVQNSFGFGDFIVGFQIFIDMVFRAVNISATLRLFGIDPSISRLFGLAVTILYIIGLAQFISNRSTKGMQ